MFVSKFRLIAKSFRFRNLQSLLTNKITLTKKLSLVTASLILFPSYAYVATEQNLNNPQQNEENNNIPQQQRQETQQQNNSQNKDDQNAREQNQQVEDQIINYIKQFEDAQKLNLRGHTLVWYQSSGVQIIDDQVINMLKKFVEENNQNMSCPYKIIIDTTKRSKQINQSNYYKKQVQLVIVKPQSLKPIPLGKYLSFNGTKDLKYETLFQRIIHEINQFTEINWTNLRQFTNGLGNRSTQAWILMVAPKNQVTWRRTKKRFGSFLAQKQAFSAHAVKAIVTDEHSTRYLGLPQYKNGENNIYILIPNSQNVIKQSHKTVTIQNKIYNIYTPWEVTQSLVFPPYLQKSNPQSYTLKIAVDLNQNISSQLSSIYQILSQKQKYPQLSSIPKFLYFTSFTEKNSKPIQISLQKNNFDQIVNAYSPECRYSNRQKRELIYSGHKWKYEPEHVSATELQQWIKSVASHQIEPTYQSQQSIQTKVKSYNSKRITGQQYLSVLSKNKSKPKIIFHYSQHCFSCKKFKHIYEQIANQKKDQFDFYRIDNDYNRTKGLRNYNSTPIFVIYKDGFKYFYKNNVFTKSLFQDFLDITREIKKIDLSLIDKCVQDRKEGGQFKLSEFL